MWGGVNKSGEFKTGVLDTRLTEIYLDVRSYAVTTIYFWFPDKSIPNQTHIT